MSMCFCASLGNGITNKFIRDLLSCSTASLSFFMLSSLKSELFLPAPFCIKQHLILSVLLAQPCLSGLSECSRFFLLRKAPMTLPQVSVHHLIFQGALLFLKAISTSSCRLLPL